MTTNLTPIPMPTWHEAQGIAARDSAKAARVWLREQGFAPTSAQRQMLVVQQTLGSTHRTFKDADGR